MKNEILGASFSAGVEEQYVTFSLGTEEYGIEAIAVQEIIALPQITKVPHLPDFIKGVINLRGTVVPIVDLRLKFTLEAKPYTKQTCIVVVNIGGRIMGMVVDAVSEVAQLPKESIDPAPPFGSRIKTDFMKGVGKIENRLLILLNAANILTDEEISKIDAVAA